MRRSRHRWIAVSFGLAICGFLIRADDAPTPDLPAPFVDRVGYPKGYREEFVRVRISDRPDSKTTAVIYANKSGATVRPGASGPYPYGSILVNETWSTVKDAAGNPVLDEAGHYKLAELMRVHVMRKEQGFGEAYLENRSGEWEYVSFGPDGHYLTPAAKSGACAQCHHLHATESRDWVFGKYEKH
jgi:hypothetical protein